MTRICISIGNILREIQIRTTHSGLTNKTDDKKYFIILTTTVRILYSKSCEYIANNIKDCIETVNLVKLKVIFNTQPLYSAFLGW